MAQAIDVRGLSKTYYLLGQVDPQLRREFYKELGSTLKSRVNSARSRMPVGSGDGPHVRALTKLSKTNSKASKAAGVGGGFRKGLFGFVALSLPGHSMILDFATRPATKQGATLIATLNSKYGSAPRFLGREFLGADKRIQLYKESQDLVRRYIARANAQIEAAANSRTVA